MILIIANFWTISSTRTNTKYHIVFCICTSDKQAVVFLS